MENTAEFNMSISTLNRVNSILWSCDENSSSLDLYAWLQSIWSLYRELSPFMKKPARKKLGKILLGYTTQLRDIGIAQLQPPIRYESGAVVETDLLTDMDLYMRLQNIEISLRILAHKKGLYIKMRNDNEVMDF